MIKINSIILHIIDKPNSMIVYSDRRLSLVNETVISFFEKHIAKCFRDSNICYAKVGISSLFYSQWQAFTRRDITFVDLSKTICKNYGEQLLASDNKESMDFLYLDFTKDNENYTGYLLLQNYSEFTHKVSQENGTIYNEVIQYHSILPSQTQRIAAYAFVNTASFNINYFDKERFIDGKDVSITYGSIMQCEDVVSTKKAMDIIKASAVSIAEDSGENSSVVLVKAKEYLSDNAEISEQVKTEELCEAIFAHDDAKAERLKAEVEKQGVPAIVPVKYEFAIRDSRKHKIKTDTGIEISVPTDFFNNKDYIEFISNEDGTLSISIKNIGKIFNK